MKSQGNGYGALAARVITFAWQDGDLDFFRSDVLYLYLGLCEMDNINVDGLIPETQRKIMFENHTIDELAALLHRSRAYVKQEASRRGWHISSAMVNGRKIRKDTFMEY